MNIEDELKHLGGRLGADVDRFVTEGKEQLTAEKAKLTADVLAHPQPLFSILRTIKPVLHVHDVAIVTRYPDVVEILTNDEAFGVAPYNEKMQALVGDFILGLDDSPEYEHDVSILRLAAPRSDMADMISFVTQTADALVAEAAAADGRVDVPDLSKRVPARLIGHWFGTPGPNEDKLIEWACAMFADIFVNVTNDPKIHAAASAAAGEWKQHLAEVIAERHASGVPAQDVLGRLIALQSNSETRFTDEQIAANLIGLMTGFVPTTATATSFALDVLLDRPDVLASAHAAALADDDDGLRAILWEGMRLAPQGPGLFRRALTDFTVAEGTMHESTIKAGTLTFAATQSAMLDPDVVTDPDDFRAGRPAHDYLHFGAGLHECFGRFANAMEIPLIAKALFKHPNLARAAGDAGKLVKTGPYPTSMAVTFDS
ncbi:MAG TPA: cytochrome P450 [Solirubrobacteraceae bacterium]|nr:cytochrome P450 [Solirubrobacteraceae bacterium]